MSTRLTVEDEVRLGTLARAGNREAEAQLVIASLPPAYAAAHRYAQRTFVPREDLEQEAALALLIAARKFNPASGVRFITYAMWWVRARLQRTCRRWYYLSQEPPADGTRWIEAMPEKAAPPPPKGVDLRLLRRLRRRRRTAVELVLGLNGHEPHTRPQMAAVLGIQPAAANKLYQRALAQLRWLARRRRQDLQHAA